MKIISQKESHDGKNSDWQSIDTCELSAAQLRVISHPKALTVLRELSEEQMHPLKLAKKLRMHEQTLYYLIHKLAKVGLIRREPSETNAKKYTVVSPSFFVRAADFQEGSGVKSTSSCLLSQFIANGKFNSKIVVGSPDPHGPHLARSRDGYFGMDLAMFLGTFVTDFPGSVVRLDTELREAEYCENLILIGGPIVNLATEKLSGGPVVFDVNKRAFVITRAKKIFVEEDIGIVCKYKNPLCKGKWILYIAGVRNYGTRAAILGLIKHFSEFEHQGAKSEEFCAVVRGLDLDADGIVDDAQIVGFY